jgi:hypothetical protein
MNDGANVKVTQSAEEYFEVRFTLYARNSGSGDNGYHSVYARFETEDQARDCYDLLSERGGSGEAERFIGQYGFYMPYIDSMDGVYKVQSVKVTRQTELVSPDPDWMDRR